MRFTKSKFWALSVALASVVAFGCGDDDSAAPNSGIASPSHEAGGDGQIVDRPADGSTQPARPKLDLLFAVDNSDSMGDKQALLASAVGRLLSPFQNYDIHVGAISSSLANGGSLCNLKNHNDQAHLIRRISQREPDKLVPGAESGFLSFGVDGTVQDIGVLGERTQSLILGTAKQVAVLSPNLKPFIGLPQNQILR